MVNFNFWCLYNECIWSLTLKFMKQLFQSQLSKNIFYFRVIHDANFQRFSSEEIVLSWWEKIDWLQKIMGNKEGELTCRPNYISLYVKWLLPCEVKFLPHICTITLCSVQCCQYEINLTPHYCNIIFLLFMEYNILNNDME